MSKHRRPTTNHQRRPRTHSWRELKHLLRLGAVPELAEVMAEKGARALKFRRKR